MCCYVGLPVCALEFIDVTSAQTVLPFVLLWHPRNSTSWSTRRSLSSLRSSCSSWRAPPTRRFTTAWYGTHAHAAGPAAGQKDRMSLTNTLGVGGKTAIISHRGGKGSGSTGEPARPSENSLQRPCQSRWLKGNSGSVGLCQFRH